MAGGDRIIKSSRRPISHFIDDFFTLDDLVSHPSPPDPRNAQEGVVQCLRKIFLEGHFDTIWLLLDASEQRRHILGGTYALRPRTQDSRGLCPGHSFKRLIGCGKGLIIFLAHLSKVFEPFDPALLPNPWWE